MRPVPRRLGRDRLDVASLATAVALVFLLGVQLPAAARVAGTGSVRTYEAPLGSAPSVARTPFYPTVGNATDLLNGSSIPAGIVPEMSTLSLASAYDPSTGEAYFLGADAPMLFAVNLSRHALGFGVPVATTAGAMVDDPTTHVLFVLTNGSVVPYRATDLRALPPMPTGNSPYSLTLDVVHQRLYVVNTVSNNVSEYDAANRTLLRNFPVGWAPDGVVYASRAGELFVADSASDNLTVDNATTGATLGSVGLGFSPDGISYDVATDRVYVGGEAGGNLTAINATNWSQRTSVGFGGGSYPDALGANPVTDRIYVARSNPEEVLALNGTTLATVGTLPGDNAFCENTQLSTDPNGSRIFLACTEGSLVEVDATDLARWSSTPLFGSAFQIAEDPRDGRLFVSDEVRFVVAVIDEATGAVIGNLTVPNTVWGLTYDPVHDRIYAAVSAMSRLAVFNATTLAWVGNITLPDWPAALWLDAATGLLYVGSNSLDSGGVEVVDTATDTDVGSFALPNSPRYLAYDPENGRLYAENGNSDQVSVLDLSLDRIVANITIHGYTGEITYDPFSGEILAMVTEPDNLTVIDPTTDSVVRSVPLPWNSASTTVDPADQELVAVGQTGNVTAFNATTYAKLGETNVGNDLAGGLFAPGAGALFVAEWSADAVLRLTPGPVRAPYIARVTATPAGVALHSGTVLNVTATGYGPLRYVYADLPAGCGSQNTSTLYCAPTDAGNYTVTVVVEGTEGPPANATVAFSVFAGVVPTLASVVVTPDSVTTPAGSTVRLNVTARLDTGSPAPAGETVFLWSLGPMSVGSLNVTTGPEVDFLAGSAGLGNLTVVATYNDVSVNATVAINVTPAAAPTLSYALIDPLGGTFVAAGATAAFQGEGILTSDAEITGPNATLAWTLAPALGSLNSTSGSVVQLRAGGANASGALQLNVTYLGVVRTASVTITVRVTGGSKGGSGGSGGPGGGSGGGNGAGGTTGGSPSNPAPPGGGWSGLELGLAALAVVAAAAVAAALVRRRGGGGSPREASEDGPAAEAEPEAGEPTSAGEEPP